jgi:Domain of unknown function (DUF4149)
LRSPGVIAYKALRESSFIYLRLLSLIAALARQHFGTLQHRIFPVYFKCNAIVSSGLLFAWIHNHSTVIAQFAQPNVPDVAQAYALGVVAITHTLNIVWFGPATSKYVTWQLLFLTPPNLLHRLLTLRDKLEKEEGKNAHDPNVSLSCDRCTCLTNYCLKASADMKKLTAKFMRLHGYSSLANLIGFLSLAFHGLWIGSYGLGA